MCFLQVFINKHYIIRNKAPEKEKLLIAFKPSIQNQLSDRYDLKYFLDILNFYEQIFRKKK